MLDGGCSLRVAAVRRAGEGLTTRPTVTFLSEINRRVWFCVRLNAIADRLNIPLHVLRLL